MITLESSKIALFEITNSTSHLISDIITYLKDSRESEAGMKKFHRNN
jgi:uncharacterized protein YuzE